MAKIPLIKPYVTEEVKRQVLEVLDSGYLTEGPVTRRFEQALADYLGCRHVLAVSNCSVGLETALRALGIGPGDEVIVPDYTYPVTAAVVNLVGATAVIVDVDPQTMLIDYDRLEAAVTGRTRAVMPVSLFGNPLDYERLWDLKRRRGLFLLEDAACALGARYQGRPVGTLADITVFSFHPRKFITTGEGGAVATDDDRLAEWMDAYKHFGMAAAASRHDTRFEMIGTNHKLSNVQAAIGLAQMRHIGELLARRTALAERYRRLLEGRPGIGLPQITPGGTHSWQSCCVFVEQRNRLIEALAARGIESQIGTYALHRHRAFGDNPRCRLAGSMEGSRWAFEHCLTLPLHHEMTDAEQDLVVAALLEAMA